VSTTPNLAIEHILQSQAQKEVTANEGFDALDQAIAGLFELDVSGGGTITVDPAAARKCKMLRLTGTLAADAEVILPTNKKPYLVHNATAGGFAVTVKTTAGAGIAVDSGLHDTAVVYCDGTDVVAISMGNSGGDDIGPYDLGVYFPGQPGAGATLLQLVAPRAFTLPAGLTGSQGYAGTAPTAQADLDIHKNGASIGTITFAASASTATFSFASEVTFAAGDRLAVIAPGSQDASLANVSITFKGTRT
jgi:hypothetical protein